MIVFRSFPTQIPALDRPLMIMKIFTFCPAFLLLFFILVSKCENLKFNKEKMLRMTYFVEKNERQFEALATNLYNYDTNFLESGNDPIPIAEIVKTELEFFAAFKIALKYNFHKALIQLLWLPTPFGNLDHEIDYYLLTLLPGLDTEDQSLKKFLIGNDLRKNKPRCLVEILEPFGKAGTFSSFSILTYVQDLWSRPSEIYSAHNYYRDIFLQMYQVLLYLRTNVSCTISEVFVVFDLIVGNIEKIEDDNFHVLRILTHFEYDPSDLTPESKHRIDSSFEYFFIKQRLHERPADFIDNNWNLRCKSFIKAFRTVYGKNDIISPIFNLMISALKSFSPFSPKGYSLRKYLRDIVALNPVQLQPLANYNFAQDLIVKVLEFAVDGESEIKEIEYTGELFDDVEDLPDQDLINNHSVINHQPQNDILNTDHLKRIYLINVPLIIEVIMHEIEIMQFWPSTRDLLKMTNLFHFDGTLKYFVFWTFSHFQIFSNSVTADMVSTETYNDLLMSSDFFLKPSASSSVELVDFQERLFKFFDPREKLKFFLRRPNNNLHQIRIIFDTFRAESDFALFSTLPKGEQEQRYVDINYDLTANCRHYYVLVYKFKDRSDDLFDFGPAARILVRKIIIAIERI